MSDLDLIPPFPDATVAVASGYYATVGDMVDFFGEARLREATNLRKSDTGLDEGRVESVGLAGATIRIHRSLAMSPYALPLVGMSPADTALLRQIAVRAAYVELYTTRLGQDLDKTGRPVNAAAGYDQWASDRLSEIAAGLVRLTAIRRDASRAPSGAVGVRL